MTLSPRSLQRSLSLQEQTYQALRSAILAGELVPGARLVETQLAKQLEVSRTPIREALRQLQQADLAMPDANGTLRVATFSQSDATQLYDCRIALEQLSVVGACQNATQQHFEELDVLVMQAEKMVESKRSHFNNYQLLDLDYQFHRLLAKSSGNLWLMSLLDQVFDKMALLRIQTMQNNPQVLEIRIEHRHIFEAIVQRNAEAAIGAIGQHLAASQTRVIREVRSLQENVVEG
ncbi:GntR family transcriptional regulator [Phormidesmis sp. 146-35]